MKFVKYNIETPFPYEFHQCKKLKEAKKIRMEIRERRGIKVSIIGITKNGNDYILNV